MCNCYNYQRQSHIISSKNATAGASGTSTQAGSRQNDKLTTLELRICRRRFIVPALDNVDITVQGSTIRLQRLRFRLKWVLNRIDHKSMIS